jgi:phosphoheptose isomerase
MIANDLQEYLKIISQLPLDKITQIARRIIDSELTIFCGNGGSYANATHMAGDILINTKISGTTVCIGDNQVAFSALSNDISYAEAMRKEIELRTKRVSGEITALLLSTSGHSKNILDILKLNHKIHIISITGNRPWPALVGDSGLSLQLEHTDAGLLESAYDLIGHLLVKEINRLLENSSDKLQ